MKTFQIEGITKQEFEELLELKIHAGICHLKKELQPEEEQLLSINATAKLLNKTRSTIYNYIKREVKPFDQPIRRAGSLYFKRSIILNYREKIS